MAREITHGDDRNLLTRVLDVSDLAAVIADVGVDRFMDEMISCLRHAFATFDPTLTEHQVRRGFSYERPELGLIEWMPTMAVGDVVSVKTVGYHPHNPSARTLPSVLATTALYDTRTGALDAICEATLLTAIRTGAASGVVTAQATRPGPIVLGVVGAGAQAVTQIHAISRVRPISRVLVTDVDPNIAASLAHRLPPGSADVEVLSPGDFARSIPDLDVLCTCTSVAVGGGPVVSLEGAKVGLHVNAVGADFPGKTELDLTDLRAATVICDIVDQCLVEGEAQRLDRSELGPDMVTLLSGRSTADLVNTRTVFDSTGWSLEDLVAARLFLDHGERLGLGSRVALHHLPHDPYSPYEVLNTSVGEDAGRKLSQGSATIPLRDPTQAGLGLTFPAEDTARVAEA